MCFRVGLCRIFVFLRRNSRIANILKTKLAVFFIYKGVVIRLMNFLEGSHFEKFFVCDSVQEIKSYRSVLYVPHCSKKCFSSSIDSGQKGQNLMFLFFVGVYPFQFQESDLIAVVWSELSCV